jgi:hypothetical protein
MGQIRLAAWAKLDEDPVARSAAEKNSRAGASAVRYGWRTGEGSCGRAPEAVSSKTKRGSMAHGPPRTGRYALRLALVNHVR